MKGGLEEGEEEEAPQVTLSRRGECGVALHCLTRADLPQWRQWHPSTSGARSAAATCADTGASVLRDLPSVPIPSRIGRGSGSGEDTGQELGRVTHIDGIPLEYPQLQEELQLDLAFLEELLHLGLSLVQLLQHRLDVVDGAVVWGLVTGDGRVSV